MRLAGWLACAALLTVADAAAAAPKPAPSITQSLDMATFGSPKISPDGRRVVGEKTSAKTRFGRYIWCDPLAPALTPAPKSPALEATPAS